MSSRWFLHKQWFLRGMAGLLLAAAAALPPAVAADDPRCALPDLMTYNEQPMPRVARRLKSGEPLRIVILGSSSSLQTTKGLPRSYVVGLPDALGQRLKDTTLRIDNLSERTFTAAQMADAIAQKIPALQPDLVIWQTGNVDAAQKVDINSFAEALNSGLQRLRSAGSDVLLVAPQFRMRLSAMVDVEPYNAAMVQIAVAEDAALFPRFEIMRHWAEAEVFDSRSTDLARQMREAEAQNRCLAEHLAAMIVAAAKLATP
jgi:cellobiose-specific phosphotransferase system component IIB